MRTAPVQVVDPSTFTAEERESIEAIAHEATRDMETLDLSRLPGAVREQLYFALVAMAKGEIVAAIAENKPLTTNEAARLLGMSRSHLVRLCHEGLVATHAIGSHLRIPTSEVVRILQSRAQAMAEAREAAATAEERRRSRIAARADSL